MALYLTNMATHKLYMIETKVYNTILFLKSFNPSILPSPTPNWEFLKYPVSTFGGNLWNQWHNCYFDFQFQKKILN